MVDHLGLKGNLAQQIFLLGKKDVIIPRLMLSEGLSELTGGLNASDASSNNRVKEKTQSFLTKGIAWIQPFGPEEMSRRI